jgi:hypothetical protein
MNNPRVYTLQWNEPLAPLAFLNLNAIIRVSNRELQIKSVTWDWHTLNETTSEVITQYNNFTQEIVCALNGANVAIPIAHPYEAVVPLIGSSNGLNIIFWTPGKRNFESFFTANDFLVGCYQLNRDPLNQMRIYHSVIIETVDLDTTTI